MKYGPTENRKETMHQESNQQTVFHGGMSLVFGVGYLHGTRENPQKKEIILQTSSLYLFTEGRTTYCVVGVERAQEEYPSDCTFLFTV